jgi:hypothetical protein
VRGSILGFLAAFSDVNGCPTMRDGIAGKVQNGRQDGE